MSIRNKLFLMLALPLTALALVGALGFRSQSATANSAAEALEDDAVVQGMNTSVKAIGAERLAVARGVQGEGLEELQSLTDDSLQELRSAADAANRTETVEPIASVIAEFVSIGRNGGPRTGLNAYNQATQSLRQSRNLIDVQYPSKDSFAEAQAVDLAVDIADIQDIVWLRYIAEDTILSALADDLRADSISVDLMRDQILDIAPSNHTGRLNANLASDVETDLRVATSAALERQARGGTPLLDAPTLAIVSRSHSDWYRQALTLQDDVSARLANISDQAEAQKNLFALLALLGAIILAGLVYVVYRSVVRPLDDLLEGAEQVASDRLPSVVAELRSLGSDDDVTLQPLTRQSDDELGSLVDAFNDVQLTAFDLAVEQARSRRNIAEMFVNLGRRNQKLLQRMLGVISELEHDERDPDKLEQLFQLDHMTTRMRRNAESLLVVAGTTAPRQWVKPVQAIDVVRSSLAEVQEYDRVDLLTIEEAPVAGNAVADVTHLLAELIENSLQFSDPSSRVTISSRWKDSSYQIVVTDNGFGMTRAELDAQNILIANPPPPDQAPTRFLGLFVVGHLAKRHDIAVELLDSTVATTEARITFPASVIGAEESPLELENELDGADGLDLDAELAALTAGSDGAPFDSESVSVPHGSVLSDLPVRGDSPATTGADPLDELTGPEETPAPFAEATAPVVDAPSAEMVIDFDDVPAPADLNTGHQEGLADLPVQGEEQLAELADLPVRGEEQLPELADLPVRGEEQLAELADLPVRGEEQLPELADLPVRGQPTADNGSAPSVSPAPMPVAETPVSPAPMPVAETPVSPAPMPVAETPVSPAPMPVAETPDPKPALTSMGLPQRTPRATIQDSASLAPQTPMAATNEPEDVATAASSVGSLFSAFQAGVQRGEQTKN